MEHTIWSALFTNAALLLALSVVYELTYLLPSRYRRFQPVYSGLMIAAICLAIMRMPFAFQPGLVYDTRSIIISVTALIFGPVPTFITVAVAVIFRLGLGGLGTLPGIAVILSSALIGLAWRRWVHVKPGKRRWLNILLMSITVHVAMLACTLLVPYPDNIKVIRAIAAPVMILYPLASILLSLLLLRQREYRNAQETLNKSEEWFRALFEKAPLGYQSLDIDGNFIEVNRQWLDTLGYDRSEVIGKPFGDFVSPEHLEAFRQRFLLFKSQGHIHSEFDMLHKSGERIFVSFEGNIGYDVDGKFKQTHCILQNITQQKAAQEERRLSEEKYRRLFETMAQGVIYQAADGTIISANPTAERILGQSLDEMRGKTPAELKWKGIRQDGSSVTGSDHPAMMALRTGKPHGPFIIGVFRPQTHDHVWLSINAIPLYHPGEALPYQVYTTFLDVTAEHKANRNYQQLFNEMVDAFAQHEIICDEKGKPVDYRFLNVNPAFELMTGCKAADIVGKTALEVLPDIEQHWIDTYGMVAQTGVPVKFENYTGISGKCYEVSVYQPAPNQFACSFSDITKRIRAEEETKKVLSRLQSLLDNSPSPIVIIDEKGNIIEESAVTKSVLGLTQAAALGEGASKAAPVEITEKLTRALSQAPGEDNIIEGIDVFEGEGGKRYFESRLFPIITPDDKERLFGYLAIDMTQRIQAETALKISEKRYSSYIENAPYGIYVMDDKGKLVETNSFASEITGYSREQLLQMSIGDITADDSLKATMQSFETLKATGSVSGEFKFVHKDGTTRWWSVDAVSLSEDRYLGFSIDITQKKEAESDLRFLAHYDCLTGLYNRRFFEAELQRLDHPNQLPISVMMGDINGVKLVNDAFGHAQGDKLIIESAKILKGCCREGDVLARIGGDEFGIIMPKTDNAAALGVLKKIKAALSACDADDRRNKFSHSVALGYETKTDMDEDLSQISRIAEQYMYERKLLEHNSSHNRIISSIKATMSEKSHETAEHAERLVAISRAIAAGLGLPQVDQDRLELLATLHDIGKVGISEGILTKQGKLNEVEWVEMRRHPEIGYRIAISTPELIPIAESILCHHERWDGKGYPQGLSGESIPLNSRILAVADAYDAMTQDRVYRKAMSHEDAIAEIQRCAGSQFDPAITKVMIDMMG